MSRSIVVGIAGGSASGKSTVVQEVVHSLGPGVSATLSHDAYYYDLSHMPLAERLKVNVDHPDSLETDLLVGHVQELLQGQSVEMPLYDYSTLTRAPSGMSVDPAPVVIVEGLLVLTDRRLRDLMTLKVFVDADEASRLARRIARDVRERGRTREEVVHYHEHRVEPMHTSFVEPTRAQADIVIGQGGHNRPAIESLTAHLTALLATT